MATIRSPELVLATRSRSASRTCSLPARRNVDVTVVVGDNFGYQSTGGQYGVTTPGGARTDSSPYGAWEPGWAEEGLDALAIVREAGAAFLARHTVLERRETIDSVKTALSTRGFTLVHVVYGCHVHFGAQALGSADDSPVVERADVFCAMTPDAYERFKGLVRGTLVYDPDRLVPDGDVAARRLAVPATARARSDLGDELFANVIFLGAITTAIDGTLAPEHVRAALAERIPRVQEENRWP
jgi:hypothetical protein